MNKYEIIAFAFLAVLTSLTAFDFIVYLLKPAPKRAYFRNRTWAMGAVAAMALVYWYVNGMKFI